MNADKVPWKIRTGDLVEHPFTDMESAMLFAFKNTGIDEMTTVCMPAGAEFTMLRRQKATR